MARNATLPLSPAQINVAAAFLPILREHAENGTPVGVHYNKRDGSAGYAEGPVVSFPGVVGMTNHSVIVDTTADKGRPSTINTWLITEVSSL